MTTSSAIAEAKKHPNFGDDGVTTRRAKSAMPLSKDAWFRVEAQKRNEELQRAFVKARRGKGIFGLTDAGQ